MKKAILVTGEHWVGKSKTINLYLKPLLGIKPKAYIFKFGKRRGLIVSQTIEESGRDIEKLIAKCSWFDWVIIATRSPKDPISKHFQVKRKLQKKGFRIKTFEIKKSSKESYYRKKAKEIFKQLV